jgi:hypothetical protein
MAGGLDPDACCKAPPSAGAGPYNPARGTWMATAAEWRCFRRWQPQPSRNKESGVNQTILDQVMECLAGDRDSNPDTQI